MDNPKNLDNNFIPGPENISVPDQAGTMEAGPAPVAFEQPSPTPTQTPVLVPDLDKISSPDINLIIAKKSSFIILN